MGENFDAFIHKDQGHKNHHDQSQLLLFQSANDDTTDVQHFRAPGHSASQFNRNQHHEVDLLILPLGTRDSRTTITDEVTDTPIRCGSQAEDRFSSSQQSNRLESASGRDPALKALSAEQPQVRDQRQLQEQPQLRDQSQPSDQPPSAVQSRQTAAEPLQVAPEVQAAPKSFAPSTDRQDFPQQTAESGNDQQDSRRYQRYAPEQRSTPVPENYFEAPAMLHQEKHHKDTDSSGSVAVGFFNGYESTSYDRQVRSAPGQYAEQTQNCKSNEANIAWVVPVYSRDSTDTQWYRETNEPLRPCVSDRSQNYYAHRR